MPFRCLEFLLVTCCNQEARYFASPRQIPCEFQNFRVRISILEWPKGSSQLVI